MKFHAPMLPILLAASFAAGASVCRGQSSAAVDARITAISCQAELIDAGSKKMRRLQSSQDVGLGLLADSQLRCTGAGYLEILLPAGTKKITSSEKTWFIIPRTPADPPYPEIANNLKKFGIPGATRGFAISSRISWPSEYSAVIPENFVVRWTPIAQKLKLSIMSDAKDVTLWGPTEVDGGTSFFQSAELSSILAAYKAKSNNSGLVLILAPAAEADWEEIHFSLLKGRAEQELNDQLEFWKKHTDGVALHLGLGYSFSRYKLFSESADEYDSALKSVPDSRYLLEESIQANRLAGRMDRVKEIQTHLASLPAQ